VVVFKAFDDKMTIYDAQSTNTAAMSAFIVRHSLPLVGELTPESAQGYMKRGLPIAKFFINIDRSPENMKHTRYYVNRLKKVATQYRDTVLFVLVDIAAEGTEQQMKDLGVQEPNTLGNGRVCSVCVCVCMWVVYVLRVVCVCAGKNLVSNSYVKAYWID